MFKITPKKAFFLSGIVSFDFYDTLLARSFVWTYRHTAHSISQELQNAFEQRHSIAEIVMEYQLEFIERILQKSQNTNRSHWQWLKTIRMKQKPWCMIFLIRLLRINWILSSSLDRKIQYGWMSALRFLTSNQYYLKS